MLTLAHSPLFLTRLQSKFKHNSPLLCASLCHLLKILLISSFVDVRRSLSYRCVGALTYPMFCQMSWMAILRSLVSETQCRNTRSESYWLDSGAALVTVLFGEGMFLFRLYALYERNKKCQYLFWFCQHRSLISRLEFSVGFDHLPLYR